MTHERRLGQFIITGIEATEGYGQLPEIVLEMQSTGEYNKELLLQVLRRGIAVSLQVPEVPR
jgi:hypothetical protein